jgi:excisionase family DNA binding protein
MAIATTLLREPFVAIKITDLRTHAESYVTTSGLAEYWQVSRKQIYKQIDAGTLVAIRLGPRSLRISTAEAIRFEEIAKMSPPSERETATRRAHDAMIAGACAQPVSSNEIR